EAGIERAREVRLADEIDLGRLLAFRLLDDAIRRDALALDRAAARRVVARRGEAQRPVPLERNDRLYRAFAEALRAEHFGAVTILQRAGDDLSRRGGGAVDQ